MFNKKITGMTAPAMVLTIIGIIIIGLVLSFWIFTFGYWLIALILEGFFSFILPFSLWYSLGAWLIALIASICILPSFLFFRSSN